MIGDGVVLLLKKIYLIMKLNFLFIFYALAGLIVFGLGPAFLATQEIYQYYEKTDTKYGFGEIIDRFKSNFIKGNITFYIQFLALFLLLINLNLASRIPEIWAAPLTIFLVIMISLVLVFSVVLLKVASIYDNSISEVYRMAVTVFFYDFKLVLKLLGLSLVLIIVSNIYKGMYVFITFGAFFMLSTKYMAPTLEVLDRTFVVKDEE